MIDQESHVSDLTWDRLLANELAAEQRDVVSGHASSCTRCAERLRELTVERDAFVVRPVRISFAKPARRRWWLGAPIAALAAAAILLVWLRTPTDGDRATRGGGERIKGGGPSLSLSAGTQNRLRTVASDDVVRPGESLQAGYSATRDGFGAVLARDGAGAAMAYVPASGDVMVALPAGVERPFPGSTVLDDVVGTERIALVWCEAARPLAPLLAELQANLELTVPAGCTIRVVVLDKRVEP